MSMQRCCPPTVLDATDRTVEAALFKALADPHRLAIVSTLARAEDEVCVCDFTAGLPLNQPTVSHHLKILRDAGLVTCERRGTWVYYRLAADATAMSPSGQHFGIVVESRDGVDAQIARLQSAGYAVDIEREETCCYASQTKVWASDPDGRRWETYFVHEDTEDRDEPGMTCCTTDAARESGATCCASAG